MPDEKLDILVRIRESGSKALRKTKQGIKGIGTESKKSTASVSGLYTKIGSLIALFAGGAFLGSTIRAFVSFDDTMRQVGAVTGSTTEQLKMLTQVAKEMGRTTRFSSTEAANGLRLLGMAGFSATKAARALPGVLNLAAAGSVDLGTAADIATNVLSAFGIEVDKLGRVNDVLVKTFTSSNTTIQELGESFKMVGPIAKGVGADFEDLFGAIGKLGDAGLKGTLAGTALRGALDALLNPTAQEAKLMEDLTARLGGVSLKVKDAENNFIGFRKIIEQLESAGLRGDEALRLFGLRAGPGMAALLNIGSDSLKDLTAAIQSAGGVSDDIAVKMESGIGGASRQTAAAFEQLRLTIIKAFEKDIIDAFKGLRNAFVDLIFIIRRLKEEGTLDAWANVIKGSFDLVGNAVRGLNFLLHDLSRAMVVVASAATGDLEAAQIAYSELGKEAEEYFLKLQKGETAYYKIDQATGEVVKSTNKYGDVLDDLGKKIDEGPIGKGRQRLTAEQKQITEALKNIVNVETELKIGLVRTRAIIEKEAAELELQYTKRLIGLNQYFDDRQDIVERRVRAELEVLKSAAKLEEDPNKRAGINAQIFALEQSLQQQMVELNQERFRELERINQEELRSRQNINDLKVRAERAHQDQIQRVKLQESGPGLLGEFQGEMIELQTKHTDELEAINKFYNAQLASLEKKNASEARMLKAHEEYKRVLSEQTTSQQIEMSNLLRDQEMRNNELRLENASNIARGLSSVFSNLYKLLGKENKKYFYLAKALAIAEATINVAQGVTKALAQGGYWGIIQGAVIAAAGAVQIATIQSEEPGYKDGGLIAGTSPTSTSDDKTIKATSGEFVEPVSAVRYYGKGVMEAIRRKAIPKAMLSGFSMPSPKYGLSHFQSGGAVGNQSGTNVRKSGGREDPINIINIVDPNVLDQWAASTPGQRSIMNVLAENPFELKQIVTSDSL